MIKEFKEFIMRGNVLDLAVAVIIAGAFGFIVKSLVDDIIMPPIGLLLGGVDFSNLVLILKEGEMIDGQLTGEVAIRYGQFIQTVINFLIIAAAIFLIIKAYNSTKRPKKEEPTAPPAPSKEEVLLTEIRDALRTTKV